MLFDVDHTYGISCCAFENYDVNFNLQNFKFKSETYYTVVIMKDNLQNFKFELLGPFFMKVGDPRKVR